MLVTQRSGFTDTCTLALNPTHQIGTLFHNAKMRELELLENRAAGMKSKAETQGKYGW